jgi:hypothetical protein
LDKPLNPPPRFQEAMSDKTIKPRNATSMNKTPNENNFGLVNYN